MNPMLAALPTLAVSLIYCTWNAYRFAIQQRQRRLRERVAYMLWVMAERMEGGDLPAQCAYQRAEAAF